MAFKRSAVRSRLSPPKRPEIVRFQVFFRLKSAVFVHSVAFIQEAAEHLLSAVLYVPEFVPELRWHTLDRVSHYPTLGNWMTLQVLPSGSSGPLRPVGKALLNRSMASNRMDSCTWRECCVISTSAWPTMLWMVERSTPNACICET